jgi:hypothetical protein
LRISLLAVIAAAAVGPALAYSQFTHEEMIDLTWSNSIRPLLLRRYPGAGEQALHVAHSYAYGGCLIQDIGYYPFGKGLFSDFAHYVRSGDFVVALLRNAANINEFAFALGALSHYVGDSVGHSQGTNPSTAVTFPDLAARYGPVVTYEEAPTAHVRTEFGFDVAQTALRRYAARAYRKRIGFRVARRLLYRSFEETYGISARGILGPARSAVPSYHWSVSTLLPAFLGAEVVLLSRSLPKDLPDNAVAEFVRDVDQSDYVALGMQGKGKPGVRAHLLAVLVKIIPKLGALKILAIKSPSLQTEGLFVNSAVFALQEFRNWMDQVASEPAANWTLPNLDLDTGSQSTPGASGKVDAAHVTLALRIAQENRPVPTQLRRYLLSYLVDVSRIATLDRDPRKRRRLESALEGLRRMP